MFVLLLAAAGLLPASSAFAHAALVVSEPANNDLLPRPPERIRIAFSEPVDTRASGMRLLDGAGNLLEIGEVTFSNQNTTMTATVTALEPGIYNVQWNNVSTVDGHSLLGSFPFTVLNPDGTAPETTNTVGAIGSDPDPAPLADGVTVRYLALFGLAMIAGIGMLVLIWPGMPETTRKLLGTVALGTGGLLLIAVMLNLRVIRVEFASLSLIDVVFTTRIGGFWLTRLGAALLIAVTATMIFDAPRKGAIGLLAGSSISILAFAMTSHAAAGTGSAWGTAIDFVHGVAAIIWVGALTAVALAAKSALSSGPSARVLGRFSLTASLMVFLLLTTGLLSTFIEVNTPDRLTDTRYGWTLVAKLALLVPLLLVALYNARWGKKLLVSSAARDRRRFAMLAGTEALLGLAVFLPAAMLTQTGVAKSVPQVSEAREFQGVQSAGDLGVTLAVDPNRVGLNSYHVRLTNAAEGTLVDADRVRLTFRYQENPDVGAGVLTLARASEGVFSGQGPYLTLQGRWRVEVEVRRPDEADQKAFFDVRPAGPPVVSSNLGGRWDNPAPGLNWNEFGGYTLIFVGIGFALWRRQLAELSRPTGYAATIMTAAGFGLGTLLLFGVHSDAPTGSVPTNPIFPDQNSIEVGKRLYENNCAACHGLNGVPPEGLGLSPYPLDLTVHVPQHPADGQIFQFISDGFPGTAMRAWGSGEDSLTEEEIWHIVNFLRTLSEADQ